MNDCKRMVVGRDVLAVLAFLLLASGMTTSAPFVDGGRLLASAAGQLAPVLDGGLADALIVVGIYLQAVVLAAVYRTASGIYRTLQRRAERARSA